MDQENKPQINLRIEAAANHVMCVCAWNTSVSVYERNEKFLTLGKVDSNYTSEERVFNTIEELMDEIVEATWSRDYHGGGDETLHIVYDLNYGFSKCVEIHNSIKRWETIKNEEGFYKVASTERMGSAHIEF